MPKTPKNKTSAYWQKRFMALEALNHGKGLKSFEYISKQYDIAAKELDEKIAACLDAIPLSTLTTANAADEYVI